jgi:hypothetical protein
VAMVISLGWLAMVWLIVMSDDDGDGHINWHLIWFDSVQYNFLDREDLTL